MKLKVQRIHKFEITNSKHMLAKLIYHVTIENRIQSNNSRYRGLIVYQSKEYLEIFRKILVLHGEVQGALEALIPCIHDLPREPIQRFLDIHIEHRVI